MRYKIFLINLLILILLPMTVGADGMVLPPPDYYVWETNQQAVILYEKGLETLVLSINYQGNVKDFAWVVPTPTRPEVTKSSDELFVSLNDLTTPIYNSIRPMPLMGYQEATIVNKGVTVLETKQIDYYELTILEANDAEALTDWLNKNGYQYPISGKYILNDYIKNGWYFTAVKLIDAEHNLSIKNQLKSGHAIPLRFDFKSKKIVYPLKISSIQTVSDKTRRYNYPNQHTGILLYIFSDNKQELPKFETTYASWVEAAVIKNLAFNTNGDPLLVPIQKKYFLTKLFRYMTKAEMTNDLYLRPAKDNVAINAPIEPEERGFTKFIVVMIIGGSLLVVLLVILLWSSKKKENAKM